MTRQNIVAFAAGLSDGMDLNENTKAGIIRRGFQEILHFVDVFYPGSRLATFFEACGLADLVTSCYGNYSLENDKSSTNHLFPLQPIAIANWPRLSSRRGNRWPNYTPLSCQDTSHWVPTLPR